MRIIFFGDGDWATRSLELLEADGHSVLGVVLRRNPSSESLIRAAKSRNLPFFLPVDVNASEFVEKVLGLGPELNVSVSYDQILKKAIRESAPMGFINFHAGKLPNFRGRAVLNWTLINGETEIGITGHYVDAGIDTGDIILQRSIPIAWTDTYADLLERTTAAFPLLVQDTVRLIAERNVQRVTQAHLVGSYFPGRGPGDEWLDWKDTSRNLYNKIRAISSPGPCARTIIDSKIIKVSRASYDPNWPKYIANPGQVVGRTPKGASVKTGDSFIVIEEIEVDGATHLPTWRIGQRLGQNLEQAICELKARIDYLEAELKRRQD